MEIINIFVISAIKKLQLDHYKANPLKAVALIIAVEYPQITVQERAKSIGVHRSTLWRWSRETIYQEDYILLSEHRNNRLRRFEANT